MASFDPAKQEMRHFRLDRIRRAHVTDEVFEPRPEVDPGAEVEGWMRTGEVQASRAARVWISPERARWAREQRRVVDELVDGSIVVELSFAGTDWLVREVLKEAGDAVVLEPEDAREAVLAAVQRCARSQPASREYSYKCHRSASVHASSARAMSRRDQIKMSEAGGGLVPGGRADGDVRHDGATRLAAFDATLVCAARIRPSSQSTEAGAASETSLHEHRSGPGHMPSPRRCATSSAISAPACRSRPASNIRSCVE